MSIREEIDQLVKVLPITSSDVIGWNSASDLNKSHSQNEIAIVPNFINGNEAEFIFSKREDKIGVGNERIKVFAGKNKEEVLKELLEELLFDAKGDEAKAIELCSSPEWWEV